MNAGRFVLTALLLVGGFGPQAQQQRTVYDRPVSAAYRVVVTVTYTEQGVSCCASLVRVSLVSQTNPTQKWELTALEEDEHTYKVERADSSAIVLCRTRPDYGVDEGCIKLFVDLASRRLVKSVDFKWDQNVTFPSDAAAQRTLGVSAEELRVLRDRHVFTTSYELRPSGRPDLFVSHPLPRSTVQEVRRARPDIAATTERVDEQLGAWQPENGGFWFGKAFYDGEGTSGVGAVGYLDANGTYTLLRIPEMIEWSTAGLLVERDVILVGRVSDPEGAEFSGGLLRYDRRSRRATVRKIPDIIHSIAHAGNAIFLGTTRGLYVLRDGVTIRYSMEPDVRGGFVAVPERIRP